MSLQAASRSICQINLENLAHNFRWLSQLGGEFCCPMVKANAYGHGAVPVAKTLERIGARQLGLMFPEEAIELRQAGVQLPLLIFGGIEPEFLEEMSTFDLTPVVSSWEQLELLEAHVAKGKGPVPIHLKVDTGMHRLGFSLDEVDKILDRLWKNKKVRLAGVLTHLSQGDDLSQEAGESHKQLRSFEEFSKKLHGFRPRLHAFASSSLLALNAKASLSEEEARWFSGFGGRPGLSLYGVSPFSRGDFTHLKPVMRVITHISAVRRICQGDSVSYGGTWRAEKDGYIGIIPFGYADGLPRGVSNQIHFTLRGREVPQIGTVCMDFSLVKLASTTEAEAHALLGEEVVLLGVPPIEPSIQSMADVAQTIPYEVMVRIGSRVRREYIQVNDA